LKIKSDSAHETATAEMMMIEATRWRSAILDIAHRLERLRPGDIEGRQTKPRWRLGPYTQR
jgi:hypothetical protein